MAASARPLTVPPVLPACPVCGAGYLDDPEGRAAHEVVFDHEPELPRQPGMWERFVGRKQAAGR